MKHDISSPVRRVDAYEKAGGYAQYIADLSWDNMLHGKLIRTTVNRGRITSITVPELPEGYHFISADDIPEGGENRINMIKSDWPVFTNDEVRFCGQTVGILAGPDRQVLHDLSDAFVITYEESLPAFTIEEGLACVGGALHGEDNLFADYNLVKGDPDGAFAKASRVIEDEIQTGFQEHIYMEPQGMTAECTDGKLVFHASCQCPFYIRKAVAPSVNLDLDDIIVNQVTTGGAFGGKEHFPDIIASALAVAVMKLKQPIQVIFERREDISWTPKRHPSQVLFKTALDDQGNILAMDIDARINAGAFESCSPIVLQRTIYSANSVYDIPNVRIRGRAVATSTVPSDAFRGFGAPQGIFAAEMHMTHLARELGVEESAFKRKYFTSKGGRTITNGTIYEDVLLEQMWERVSEVSGYYEKAAQFAPGSGKGIGAAFYLHGGGFTGDGEQALINARVKVQGRSDGRAEILLSNVEMGQGLLTTFRKIAAYALDLDVSKIIFENPATSRVPDSGPTVASRSVMVVGRLVQKASERLKEIWDGTQEQTAEAVYEHPPWVAWDQKTMQGDAYPAYSWGICVVEVEVDPASFEVEIQGVWTIHEIGKAIDETIVHGQVIGGVVQALGYASLEKMELKDGRFYQNTMADYIIPTTLDVPQVHSELVENPYEYGPYGAKGLGELVFDGAAAAYADAVQRAVGRTIDRIPVTPEYLMELKDL